MRVLLAIAALTIAIAGGATRATAGHLAAYAAHRFDHADRAGMVLVTSEGPGVALRAYWRAPWRDRHYFPVTGKRPRIGRAENLSARGPRPHPVQTFRRTWSNASAFKHERPIYVLPPESDRRRAPPHEMKP